MLAGVSLGCATWVHAAKAWNESGGLVIMEMENSESPKGNWLKKTGLNGYKGSGYYEFNANTYETGKADSPLEFYFKINSGGTYYLNIRCAKTMKDGRSDVANDCYVRVEGDYEAGPTPHYGHGRNADKQLLFSDTKYFGGKRDAWQWEDGVAGGNGNLDPGGHNNKRKARYEFKAGKVYRLVVSGRSKFFRIDRIAFRKGNSSGNLNGGESSTFNYTLPPMDNTLPAGRLAYVADGNSKDPDDVSANAAVIALIAAAGKQSKLVHCSYGCDLKPNVGNNPVNDQDNWVYREGRLKKSYVDTADAWGGFGHLTFYNCRTQTSAAKNDLKDAINASSSSNPLSIIEAGEPDIIIDALRAATASKRQYVSVITHHRANDNGGEDDNHEWKDLLALGVKEVRIPDQNHGNDLNKGLRKNVSEYHWARDHADARVRVLWDRNKAAETDRFAGFDGKVDISDAGMVMFWISGAYEKNGLDRPQMSHFKSFILDNLSSGVDIGQTVNAALFDAESHPNDNNNIRDNGNSIGYIKNGSWVRYNDFNFGDGCGKIEVLASTPNSGKIEVRYRSLTGPLLGTINISNTGGWNNYKTFSKKISSRGGVRDLYLVFKGGSGGLFNLRSFKVLSYADGRSTKKTENTSSSLVYSGTWKTQNNASDSRGSIKWSKTEGNRVKYTFTGDRAKVAVRKGPHGGKCRIFLDGNVVATSVNTYASSGVYKKVIHDTGVLKTYGKHTIEVVVLGGNKNIMFDFFSTNE